MAYTAVPASKKKIKDVRKVYCYSHNRILNELKIIKTTRKLKYRTKQLLSMFMLLFSKDENVNKIFSIKDIKGIRMNIQHYSPI